MQPRFEKRVGSTPFGLVEQPRFRAAFDFMRLRADIGEVDVVLADWWQEFSMADDATREDLVFQVKAEQQKSARAPRVHRAPTVAGGVGQLERDGGPGALPAANPPSASRVPEMEFRDVAGEAGGEAPKKRRRRRRKPLADGDAGSGSAPAGE